ncbi:hypothetical protein R3P38DRAFT_2708048 [Favolaschia claudopus]|uniref:NAD(P)-binding protein n=1 Tax=Favolaschia claudopus TaxID=2862362 RepID=A0AAW0BG28_9AGAR
MGQFLSFIPIFFSAQFFRKLADSKADLEGRTYLVTGSNTGIGLGVAVHLARLNPALLILAVRDLDKGAAAKETIIAETDFKGCLEVWELDMASFASVKKFAERVNTTLERLDGASLNAGINLWDWRTTDDGWERTLQVNDLATGLLGLLLLPKLQATSKLSHPHTDTALPPPSHLTITGSEGMFLAKFSEKSAPKILEAMNDKAQCKDIRDRYFTSKLLNLYLAREISKSPHAQGVVVNAATLMLKCLVWFPPGLCNTEIARDLKVPSFVISLAKRAAFTPSQGALTLLYGLLRDTPPGAFIYACKITEPPSWTKTKRGLDLQAKVWSEMVEVWRAVAPEVIDLVTV